MDPGDAVGATETGRSRLLVRSAGEADFDEWFDLFVAVAGEERWIGREPPVDREEQRQRFLDAFAANEGCGTAMLAEAGERQVGQLSVRVNIAGIGDLAMLVAADRRRQGVGTALMAAAVEWAHQHQLHKLTLQLWPHNLAAYRLYQQFGFVEEGRLRRHYRRRSGELWDAIVMGRVLDTTSPGSSVQPEQPGHPNNLGSSGVSGVT